MSTTLAGEAQSSLAEFFNVHPSTISRVARGACPVITVFCVSWNDSLRSDADRDLLLKPLIPLVIGTRSTDAVAERRRYMALDWLIRVFTPKWLDMVPSLYRHAKALRELDAIADMDGAAAAGKLVEVARDAAGAAAGAALGAASWWDLAWDATWDAAWDAGGAAAGPAAVAAVGAALGTAAWDAAWDAPGAAAWAAAVAAFGAAAGDSLKPTTEWLQGSAQQLLHDMIAVQPDVAEAP